MEEAVQLDSMPSTPGTPHAAQLDALHSDGSSPRGSAEVGGDWHMVNYGPGSEAGSRPSSPKAPPPDSVEEAAPAPPLLLVVVDDEQQPAPQSDAAGAGEPAPELTLDAAPLESSSSAQSSISALPSSIFALPEEVATGADVEPGAELEATPPAADQAAAVLVGAEGGAPAVGENAEQAAAAAVEVEGVLALSRLSQEGSLDAFSETGSAEDDLLLQGLGFAPEGAPAGVAAAARQEMALVVLGGGPVVGFLGHVRRDVVELSNMVAGAVRYMWASLLGGEPAEGDEDALADEDGLLADQGAAGEVAKPVFLGATATRWALLALGGVTVVALVGLAVQLRSQRTLRVQLRQRDRELARLVVKILHLQDMLAAPRQGVPMMRHTAMAHSASIDHRFPVYTFM